MSEMPRQISGFDDVPLPGAKPCPFCDSTELTLLESEDGECFVFCEQCLTEGPLAIPPEDEDEDEDAPWDLEMSAVEGWNRRGGKP